MVSTGSWLLNSTTFGRGIIGTVQQHINCLFICPTTCAQACAMKWEIISVYCIKRKALTQGFHKLLHVNKCREFIPRVYRIQNGSSSRFVLIVYCLFQGLPTMFERRQMFARYYTQVMTFGDGACSAAASLKASELRLQRNSSRATPDSMSNLIAHYAGRDY